MLVAYCYGANSLPTLKSSQSMLMAVGDVIRWCDTYRLDCGLNEVLLVREVEIGVVAVDLLAHGLHRDLLQIGSLQDLLHVLLDFIVLKHTDFF